jgi:hypothetical protein
MVDPMEVLLEERMTEVLDTIVAMLTAADSDVPSRVINVVPGESIVWDQCCNGGQLTARLANMVPHYSHTTKQAQMTPCSIDYWTATVEVTLLRCAAVQNNAGAPPSAERIGANGSLSLSDMRIILQAMTTRDFVDDVNGFEALGPNGGCMGMSWQFYTKLDSTPCGE